MNRKMNRSPGPVAGLAIVVFVVSIVILVTECDRHASAAVSFSSAKERLAAVAEVGRLEVYCDDGRLHTLSSGGFQCSVQGAEGSVLVYVLVYSDVSREPLVPDGRATLRIKDGGIVEWDYDHNWFFLEDL